MAAWGAVLAASSVLASSLIAPALADPRAGHLATHHVDRPCGGPPRFRAKAFLQRRCPHLYRRYPPDVPVTIEYEPQTTCEDSPKPGALRLEQIIKSTYGANQYTWIPRDCDKGGAQRTQGRPGDRLDGRRARSPTTRHRPRLFWGGFSAPTQAAVPTATRCSWESCTSDGTTGSGVGTRWIEDGRS